MHHEASKRLSQSKTPETKPFTATLIPISKPSEDVKYPSPEFPGENIDLDLNTSVPQISDYSPIGRLGSSIISQSVGNSSFIRGKSPLKRRSYDRPT